MNQGIEISTSGVLTSMHRQDVLTANLANLNTVGYKPSVPGVRQRDVVRDEDGLMHLPSNALLERLGGGAVPAATRISFSQGAIENTGNDLDLAIRGDGFLAVETREGPALTRDGRLTINDQGQLVLASTGHKVLSSAGTVIRLPHDQAVSIANDGTIQAGGTPAGALRFVDVPDRSALVKDGAGLFRIPGNGEASLVPAGGSIIQGAIEQSSVSEIDAMMQVTAASRAVSSNIGLISYQDQLMQRTINQFARVG